MKKLIIVFIICAILLSSLSAFISADNVATSWYCVRNKSHKQPIADTNLQYVEEYNGYYIDHTHGDNSKDKVIYLTFDAGYENGNIAKILDVLREEQVSAAFFILENLILKNTDLVKRMADEGHIIANHTTKHADVTKYNNINDMKTDLESLEALCLEKTGYVMPKYFRCPEGKFSKRSMQFANELGYKTIFWSFAYADWNNNSQPSSEEAKDKILSNIHNGEIMLLHPTSETNAKILKDIIKELKSQGFRFGTLDELTANQ